VSEQQVKVSMALKKLANEKGASITGVALAYVMHKAPYISPIYGGRKTDHVEININTLALSLSDKEMAKIGNAWSFGVSFPMGFSNSDIYHLKLIDLERREAAYDQKVALQWQLQLKALLTAKFTKQQTNYASIPN
jgi:hypothetical protein